MEAAAQARDHIGYGPDGRVTRDPAISSTISVVQSSVADFHGFFRTSGPIPPCWFLSMQEDVQITAVSGENPDWFVGTRTPPGPLTTKKVPVRVPADLAVVFLAY